MRIAQDIIYRARVNSLRDICVGGPVTIKDAITGQVKGVVKMPLTYEDIILDGCHLLRRVTLKRYTKK
jgi:hypothetical protein